MRKVIPSPQSIFLLLSIAVAGVYAIARWNFLLFHMAVEGYSVMAAALIYILATRTYKFTRDGLLHFLGASCICTATLISIHLLTMPGMNIFPTSDLNRSSQFWLTAQLFQALTLLLAPCFTKRSFANNRIAYLFIGLTGIAIVLIIGFSIFPKLFDHNLPLPFWTWAQLTVVFLLLGAAVHFFIQRRRMSQTLYRPVIFSLMSALLSGLCFASPIDFFRVLDFFGHLFYAFSSYQLYRGIVLKGLESPYQTIFAELKKCATTDPLTGLLNRLGFNDMLRKEFGDAVRSGQPMGLLYLDVDNFKKINDCYGHSFGDDVLRQIARIIKEVLNERATAGRLGGDEFAIAIGGGEEETTLIADQVGSSLHQWFRSRGVTRILGISIGSAVWNPGDPVYLQILLDKADEAMYREKSRNKASVPTRR